MEEVILVNEQDEQVGSMEKMEAHYKGALHRAFSVFIFNNKGEMLLQQRAITKYHSGGLWTNACCSHPRPGESTNEAADRRLQEELGFSTSIKKIFDFKYNASFNNGLIEHEFDHVYVGNFQGQVKPNPSEVQDYCYMTMKDILASTQSHPHKYTAWFCIAFPQVYKWWQSQQAQVV
jgi:isopentenyl-diphosphate Delta-isomerase